MPISDADLDYETHIAKYRYMGVLKNDPVLDVYWHHSAQEIHALVVADAIRDLAYRVGQLGLSVETDKGRYQLQFGASRRALQIHRSYRNIMSIIPPDRLVPLTYDYAHEVERDLNVIYINLRGLLDNLAGSIYEQLGADHFKDLQENLVGLFNKAFRKVVANETFDLFVAQHDQWNAEFKDRRDPSAHRIRSTMMQGRMGKCVASALSAMHVYCVKPM